MRKSKHALLVIASLIPLLSGCGIPADDSAKEVSPEPSVIRASTEWEAYKGCLTLSSEYVSDCLEAVANTEWEK